MRFGNLKLRHELKFYINHHEYLGLRERIRPLLTPDKYSVSEAGYHIRSLYFDNWYETALHDKVDGIFDRKKYRIRIYNVEDDVIRMERKSRLGEYINKVSAPLTREQYEWIAAGDYAFMQHSEHELLRKFYIDSVTSRLKPSVIVDYMREAYVFPVSDVRITFDKQLRGSVNSLDLFDKQLVTASVVPEPQLILEVKFNEFLPTVVHNLLQLDSHNRSAISKYVLCRVIRKGFAD